MIGQWIWNGKAQLKNVYVDFIREIDFLNADPKAQIRIAADSEYELTINGEFVNCGTFKDYPEIKCIDTINIGEYLRKGKNRICVTVYHYGKSTFQYAPGKPGLWFEILNGSEYVCSDENVLSAPSGCFVQGDIYDTTGQLGYGFIYDGSKDDCWKTDEIPKRFEKSLESGGVRYKDRPVKKCIFEPVENVKIKTQGVFFRKEETDNIAAMMQTDYLSHREKNIIFDENMNIKTDENVFAVFDLQREQCGYITFTVCAEEGTVIDFSYGEHLEDLRVRSFVGGRCFANRYICKNGRQTFTYYFRRVAGRYIEMHISGKMHKIETVGIIGSVYPFDKYNEFNSSDSLCNKIYEISADTLKHCAHEHYEDCPWREQALYGSDSRNQMLCTYYLHNDYEFAKASLDLLGSSIGDGKYAMMVAPSDSKLIIPSFSFIWILALNEYTAYSGDRSLAEKYKDKIKYMIESCTLSMERGIARHPSGLECWNFYEWAEGNDGIVNNSSVTDMLDYKNGRMDGLYQMFLFAAIKSASELYGDSDYAEILTNMKAGINKVFWDDGKQLYAAYVDKGVKNHYCELMQIMAVYNDIAEKRAQHLCSILTSSNDLVKVTLSYRVYLYDALLKQETSYAKWVYENITEVWGNMLFNGATTFWETAGGADDFDNAGSLCHGWSAIPIYVFGKYCKQSNNVFAPYLYLK